MTKLTPDPLADMKNTVVDVVGADGHVERIRLGNMIVPTESPNFAVLPPIDRSKVSAGSAVAKALKEADDLGF